MQHSKPSSYSQYSLLISAEQLAASLDQDNLIILDASIPPVGGGKKPEKCWPNTRLPNAQRFDLGNNFSDKQNPLPYSFPSTKQFNEQAQKLGINQNSQIVIYDELGVFSSARAWWMFRAMGHKNVAVLDGGLPCWLEHNYPTSNVELAAVDNSELGDFLGQLNNNYFCDRLKVLDAVNKACYLVLDARAAGRFSGEEQEPRPGMRSGHMPGALNLPYKNLLLNGCFLSIESLQKQYSSIIQTDQTIIMSCGSGITACILALGAELCGYTDITVYDGSWSEWGALAELPISPS